MIFRYGLEEFCVGEASNLGSASGRGTLTFRISASKSPPSKKFRGGSGAQRGGRHNS